MGKLQRYKDRWADEPGETQRERWAREQAVLSAEQDLTNKARAFIEGERVDIARTGDAVARSTADVESAARAMRKAMRTRLVDVQEMADQLATLKKQARRNRSAIAEIAPRQEANERRAEDPVGYMENFYEKFPALPNPVDALPGFRTDSERAMATHEDQEKRRERRVASATEERAKRSRAKLR